jgi:hypothetical protein
MAGGCATMVGMNTFSSSFGSPREPTPEELAQVERYRAEMAGAPENVVPVAWPFTAVVGRNDAAAVIVVGGEVFGAGIAFRLIAVVRRAGSAALDPVSFWPRHGLPHSPAQGVLRFGVRYADGRTADNLQDMAQGPFGPDLDAAAPRLRPMSGHGDPHRWVQDLFLRPLPPDGPLDLFCEWPALGIAESRATIDLSGIASAAARTVELWPLEPEPVWEPPVPRLGEPGPGFFRPILDDRPG